ncbi:MAG: M23 family peptidase [Persephonella sp.]|nr:MAG: M23 family peptidase [Persephonella sp.]
MRDKFLLFVVITMIVGGIYLYLKGYIDFGNPKIQVLNTELKNYSYDSKDLKVISKNYSVKFRIVDDHSGLKDIKIIISQDGEDKFVKEISFPEKVKEKEIDVNIDADKYKLKKGEVDLIVSVTDRGLFENKTILPFRFILDPDPPIITKLYTQQYIMNGGSAFAFFKVSKDTEKVYIHMENLKFNCFSGLFKDKTVYACAFPYPYYWNTKKKIFVSAVDKAGNITTLPIPYRFKLKKYRRSVVNISDKFIEEKVKPLVKDKNITDPVEMFKYVNVVLRKENEKVIHNITRTVVIKKPMFKTKLARMKRAAVLGGFADYRKYRYKGKIIEGADAYHKGMDMASIKNAEVPAAEDGVVVYTGNLGIYGNTIIIEHGLGVFTLYSHLLDFAVKKGDIVKRGQLIAHTDTTGLAVGDHLHFGVLIQGLEVHPIEWFDKRWLKTRFFDHYEKLKKEYGENGGN